MSNPQNQQFWNKIAQRSTDIQQQFWYGAEKLAKYLNDNPAEYSRYMSYDTSTPDPSWPFWKKWMFYVGQSEYNQSVTSYNTSQVILEKGSWLWGMLKGDFNKDPSMSQIIVGGLISLIPVVDQVCDVRDLIANIVTLSDAKNRTTDNYMALAITGVGIIPEIGSAIKTVVKAIRKKGATKLDVLKTMEHFETALTKLKIKCPWGRAPDKWLKSNPWKGIADQALNALKNNFNRMILVIDEFIKKFKGSLQSALTQLKGTLIAIRDSIKTYLYKLADEIHATMSGLSQQSHLATAGGHPPTGRYQVSVNSGKKTEAGHHQKATAPEKDKPKKDKLDDPCILRPYKPDTCKPLGKTGHHVVPDRCFRLGSRTGEGRNQLRGGLSTNDGLVICVIGATPKPTNEHGKIHAAYSLLEAGLKDFFNPTGTAPIAEVEVIGAKAVEQVLKKCSAARIAAQLRTYHESKGINMNYRVRVGVFATDAKKADPNIFGNPRSNKNNGSARE
ncbi:hypothetical protein [Acinetobacter sp. MB5]|uniref:hypothetical protein n=1 Tax=Acinetobacter sp. MB5 TaxID=2069438 RepID=UPI000DD01122|nr:hypothetical protein [Acinetobacter sp. MB5]